MVIEKQEKEFVLELGTGKNPAGGVAPRHQYNRNFGVERRRGIKAHVCGGGRKVGGLNRRGGGEAESARNKS